MREGGQLRNGLQNRGQRDPGGRFNRIAKDPGRNSRKGDGSKAVLFGQPKGIGIAIGQQFVGRFVLAIDGSQAMDDGPVGQLVAPRDDRLTRTNGSERPAFFLQPRSGSPMDGSGHASARSQMRIGRVDDGVHAGLIGDISPHTFEGDAVDGSLCDGMALLFNNQRPPCEDEPSCLTGAC